MSTYACDICKKEFKTTQHLNQHKNRKKLCTLVNTHLNDIVTLPQANTSGDLSVIDIMNFIKTAESIQNLINDSKLIQEYKRRIINLTKENDSLKAQIKNIQQIIHLASINNTQSTVADVNDAETIYSKNTDSKNTDSKNTDSKNTDSKNDDSNLC